MNEEKRLSLTRGASRRGTMSAALIAVVVAIVIILNLIVGQLPSNILQIDMSDQKLYSISDVSKEYAASIDAEIEFILLSELSATDERISKFVNNYASLSSRITVSTVDPVLYPSVLETYSAEINSLVVKNKETGKFRVIPYGATEDALIIYSLDWSTYDYYESGFDADGQITSAISYVSNESSGTVYTLSGHGESELGATEIDLIGKSNLTLSEKSVDILLDGGIPDDCGLLVINAPTGDIAPDERDVLLEYLAGGGDVFVISDISDCENLAGVLSEYGMELCSGFIGDTTRYYQQYASFYGYMCVAPVLSGSNELTMGIDANAFVIYPRGMLLGEPVRDTITTSAFLSTSETGIEFIDDTNTTPGTYVIGALATEETESGDEARLTVVLSSSMFSEEIVSTLPSMANTAIFTNIVTAGFEGASDIVIPAKSLDVETNTIDSYQWWSLLYIGVIPICVFVGGLVFWTKRRKK